MRVLLVKMTSMGDVVHALPAITDALNVLPDVTFDWVVEEGFSEIPRWHFGVNNVISTAIRRWRKKPVMALYSGEFNNFIKLLRSYKYDAVIDAQGLLKSAIVSCVARGKRYGLNRMSAKEGLASQFYHISQNVPWQLHAVERIRLLFALSLQYSVPKTLGDYNLNNQLFELQHPRKFPYVVFVHSASKANKLWLEEYWCQLAEKVILQGVQVLFPWGIELERKRAERMVVSINQKVGSAHVGKAFVLNKSTLTELAQIFIGSKAVVSIDTGLSHVAAALDVHLISMYSVTNPNSVGVYGKNAVRLIPDKLIDSEQKKTVVTVRQVWDKLYYLLRDVNL